MKKELWKGNEAVAQAAINAGCRYFFGYPITPQNEIPEYMAAHLPEVGGCFLQSESEVAAINMVYGAAGAGARVMTSSSSPGISLKQEGITYLVGSELPAVIVNAMRGGPGLGTIQPAQGDYFQATRGGGNGDYRTVVLAPSSVQEAADLTAEAFDIADQYRNPVLVLMDGMIGQMMEAMTWRPLPRRELPPKAWATTGTGGRREKNIINSWRSNGALLEEHNLHFAEKWRAMEAREVRWEERGAEGAQLLFVAYGTTARLVAGAMEQLEARGVRCALLRPISLWPYPAARLRALAEQPSVRAVFAVELSLGQMVEDVRLAVEGVKPVGFFGRAGGAIPTPREIAEHALDFLEGR